MSSNAAHGLSREKYPAGFRNNNPKLLDHVVGILEQPGAVIAQSVAAAIGIASAELVTAVTGVARRRDGGPASHT